MNICNCDPGVVRQMVLLWLKSFSCCSSDLKIVAMIRGPGLLLAPNVSEHSVH